MIATPAQSERIQSATDSISLEVSAAIESEHVQLGGIADGLSGFALLFEYRAECIGNAGDLETAAGIATRAFRTMDRTALQGFHRGLPGIAWTLRAIFGEADGEAGGLESAFDSAASEVLERLSNTPAMEAGLGNGLAGIGMFAIDAAPPGRRDEIASVVLDQLRDSATRDNDGARWITAPERMPAWHRARSEGYVDLTVASGLPGVCYFLARAIEADVCAAEAGELLEACWRWLFSTPAAEAYRFDDFVPPLHGSDRSARQVAWCRGDLGVSVTTLAAATAAGDQAVAASALVIARDAIAGEAMSTAGRDACLCHGWAGLLQLCNRLYQATGEDLFRERACDCLEQTLRLCEVEGGLRFIYPLAPSAPTPSLRSSIDLLAGASGVALALHAAASDVEPIWDRPLAIDVEPSKGQT